MYKIYHQHEVITGLIITDGLSRIPSDLSRREGDISPVYQLCYGDKPPLLFEHIEQCYALISFLALVGYEGFEVRCTEELEE